ncbi:hypothetical protein ACFP47_11640 [Nesterenkonia lacusekhoensis]|uniref:Secreted protein n=1 Tax=Nesterenkonia lacusekhoensis TaxID=150832 RepID=A0ABS4T3U3_9MICC|nr:hypothetical protein [Nesterenkonia lacusekhoensis]MBP2319125.1 hypothetical protein [Nesterenkonia lacusekhoensis]
MTGLLATSTLAVAPAATANAEPLDEIDDISVVAEEVIEQAQAEDPEGFENRTDLVLNTESFQSLPGEASLNDRAADAEVLAATVEDEQVLTGLMEMLDAGVITPETTEDGEDYWHVHEDKVEELQVGTDGATTASMPQCPAAWTAALSWISINGGKCALFGPKAAVACAIGYGIAGEIIDYNRACN